MTYYNGNPYYPPTETAPLDKFAHDDCLPDELFDPIVINGKTEDENGEPHGRQQKHPWSWSPVWGAPEPCYACHEPVR